MPFFAICICDVSCSAAMHLAVVESWRAPVQHWRPAQIFVAEASHMLSTFVLQPWRLHISACCRAVVMQSHSSLGHFSTNTPMNMNRFAGNTMNAFQPHAGQFQHMSRATNMLPMNLSAQQPSLNMGSNRSVGQSIAAGRVLQPPNMQPRPTNPALPSRGVVNMVSGSDKSAFFFFCT